MCRIFSFSIPFPKFPRFSESEARHDVKETDVSRRCCKEQATKFSLLSDVAALQEESGVFSM